MGLQVKQYPRPYALHWLSPQGVVHVHKQVRVPLSIGDYTDEIVCDVVPMEATHLILGRPWQYDLRAKYDGYTNEYTIQQQGKAYKLLPMSPLEVQQTRFICIKKPKGKRSLFIWSNRAKDQDSRSNLLQQGGNDMNSRAKMRVSEKPKPTRAEEGSTGSKRGRNKRRGGKGRSTASLKPALNKGRPGEIKGRRPLKAGLH